MTINSITWNVNPWIIFFGDEYFIEGIRWYGLLFALGFVFGYIIFTKFFKKKGLSIELLDKLTMYMVIGTIVGARLGHCLFYDYEYFIKEKHFIEILYINKGGLASHGGGIGVLIALFLYVRKTKISFLWLIDRIAIVAALAGFFIRMGNLMNSEIYGRPTNLPWGFSFIRDRSRVNFYDNESGELIGQHLPCHPTQIYEGLSYLIIFLVLFWLVRKYAPKLKEGVIFSWFLISVFTARFLIEYVKFEQSDFELNMISKLHVNMGQLLSIPFIVIGVILLLWIRKKGKYTAVE